MELLRQRSLHHDAGLHHRNEQLAAQSQVRAPRRPGPGQSAQFAPDRQFRFGCLIEQAPQHDNRVTIDKTYKDGLGIPRPHVEYGLDEYTMEGFAMAAAACTAAFKQMGRRSSRGRRSIPAGRDVPGPDDFVYKGTKYHSYGAGHIVGTHRMGPKAESSVVDASQKSHDVQNLWIVGSGSFPTVATPNPTLTIMALAFKSADSIIAALGSK